MALKTGVLLRMDTLQTWVVIIFYFIAIAIIVKLVNSTVSPTMLNYLVILSVIVFFGGFILIHVLIRIGSK